MLHKILIFQQLVWAFYIITLIVYFSDLYPAKILNFSAKSFFPYIEQSIKHPWNSVVFHKLDELTIFIFCWYPKGYTYICDINYICNINNILNNIPSTPNCFHVFSSICARLIGNICKTSCEFHIREILSLDEISVKTGYLINETFWHKSGTRSLISIKIKTRYN